MGQSKIHKEEADPTTAKKRVEGNCLPVCLLLENLKHLRRSDILKGTYNPEVWYEDIIIRCNDVLREYINELQTYCRSQVANRAQKLARRLYFGYIEENKFDTRKVFMLISDWTYKLSQEGLIDIFSEDFINMLRTMDEMFAIAVEEGHTEDGKVYTPEDMRKIYISAGKHVRKVHSIAMEEGLYLVSIVD